jgi:filamentous hemagglutinin family protein
MNKATFFNGLTSALTIAPLTLLTLGAILPQSSLAQSITVDGSTATIVNQQGQEYVIDILNNGTLSADGANLFHSFEQFGLSAGEIANFLSNPTIQNILGRVTGGNPSLIDGLIKVTGADSNLFLMNPAGIIFGSGASLDVNGSFTATTADKIGFGDNFFNALGENDYSSFTGNPNSFVFTSSNPGSIINAGNLEVNEELNISLIGGNVINTGTITAPSGNVTIQAVPGSSKVRISPQGSALSIDVDPAFLAEGISPLSLSSLLTGEAQNLATGVEVATDGTVTLVGSDIALPTATGTNIIAGKVDVSGANGGNIQLLGEIVGLIDGDVTASGITGDGGTILIGGDQEGKGSIPTAQTVYINENSTVNANAGINGDGGTIIAFAKDYANIQGNLTARGGTISGNGGFIETSGLESFNIETTPDVGATNGIGGTWLIDPRDITIAANATPNTNVNITGTFTANGNNAIIRIGNLLTALNNGNVTISTGTTGGQSGNITLATDLNFVGSGGTGTRTLTLNAANNIILNNAITNTAGTRSLSLVFNADGGDGTIQANNGTIDVRGSIDFNGNVQLGTNVNITSSQNNNIRFRENVTGMNQNLTVNAGSGNVTFDEAVGTGTGAGTRLGNLIVNSTGDTTFGNSINAATITTNAGGTTFLDGNVTSNGVINFGNAVQLEDSVTVTSNNGNVTFDGNVTRDGIARNLTVSAGSGNVEFNGTVGNTNRINNLIVNSTGDTTFNSTVNITSLTTNAGGNTFLGGNVTATGGEINFNDAVLLSNNVTISTTFNQDINFASTVDSFNTTPRNLTVNTSGNGDITFTGAVGNNNALGNLIVNSGDDTTFSSSVTANAITTNAGDQIRLNGDVTATGGAINFNGDVLLNNNITVNSTNQNITFGDTVNSNTTFRNLTINAGSGNVLFDSAVGNNNRINNLIVNSTGDTTFDSTVAITSLTTDAGGRTILDGNITRTGAGGAIFFGDAVRLDDDLTITSNNGSVTFNNTLDSHTTNDRNLTVNAGTGNILFNGAVGNTNSLDDLEANSTGNTTFNGNVNATSVTTNAGGTTTINANILTSSGQTYNDAVTINGDRTLQTGPTLSALNFNNTLNAGSGTVTLRSFDVNFFNNVTGTGTLILEPTPSTRPVRIGFGGTESGTTTQFDVTNAELTRIQAGFTKVIIGAANGTGEVALGGGTFNNPTEIRGTNYTITTVGTAGTNTSNVNNVTVEVTGNNAGNITDGGLTFNGNGALSFIGANTFIGSNGTGDKVIGTPNDDNFSITGNNAFNFGNIAFSSMENVDGGDGDDTIAFNGGSLTGSVNGGIGINTLIGEQNTTNQFNITGENQGTLVDKTGNGFSNIQNLTGGNQNDTFAFNNGANIDGLIDGGAGAEDTVDYSAYTDDATADLNRIRNVEIGIGGQGANDTLVGVTDTPNNWQITGANEGTVNANDQITFNFRDFENLTGGDQEDTFAFADQATLTGNIDGGGANNTIDYSAYTTPLIFNITGENQGSVNPTFIRIQNLRGGTANDTFKFVGATAFLRGNLDGGRNQNDTDVDTLDYSQYPTAFTFGLGDTTLGTATGVGGNIFEIERVIPEPPAVIPPTPETPVTPETPTVETPENPALDLTNPPRETAISDLDKSCTLPVANIEGLEDLDINEEIPNLRPNCNPNLIEELDVTE